MRTSRNRRPSPAMVVAIIALITALAGTAYAAQTINGGAIKKQTIGGGKLKQKTLTGYQINTNKLGIVPSAKRAAHTYWAVVNNPAGAGNATLARASDAGVTAVEGGGAIAVAFPANVSVCANVAGRDNAGTTVPGAGLRADEHHGRQPQRDRSPHPGRERRQRGRRLPPDRRLPLRSCPRQWVSPRPGPRLPSWGRAGSSPPRIG